MSNKDSDDFARGMWTVGTPLENPFPNMFERSGQDFARVGQTSHSGGGDASGCILLVLALVFLGYAISFVPVALPTALVVMAVSQLIGPAPLRYANAFVATLLATMAFSLGIAAVVGLAAFLAQDLAQSPIWSDIMTAASYLLIKISWMADIFAIDEMIDEVPPPALSVLAPAFALLFGPALLLATFATKIVLGRLAGYSWSWSSAFIFAVTVVVTGTLVAGFISRFVLPEIDPRSVLAEANWTVFFISVGSALAIVCIPAAAVLAAVLAIARSPASNGRPRFWHSFRVSTAALIVATVVTMAMFLFFRHGDPVILMLGSSLFEGGWSVADPYQRRFSGIFTLLFPGTVIAAFIVAFNLQGYDGLLGSIKAMAITVPLSAITVIAAVVGVIALTNGGYVQA
jgi:MFS family permease